MNPFKYGSTVAAEHFCPRPSLVTQISGHLVSKQNIHVEGARRTGKTSLVLHVCGEIKKAAVLHVDFMMVRSIEDMRARIVDGLSKVSLKAGGFERLVKALAHLRPTLSVNPATGEPTVSLGPTGNTKIDGKSLVELLELARSNLAGHNPVIFFDEFQDVLRLPDAMPLLAVLRSSIQHHHDCAYIFSGSSRSEMAAIFREPDSPFFKSAIPVPVGPLSRNDFVPFLLGKFHQGQREVTENMIEEMLGMVADNPGDAQEFCNCLWEVMGQEVAGSPLEAALNLIFAREQRYFEQVIDALTPTQKKCLHGVAAVNGKGVYSAAFFERTGIHNTGTITKALKRLKERRILHDAGGALTFNSPFLKLWLLRNPQL